VVSRLFAGEPSSLVVRLIFFPDVYAPEAVQTVYCLVFILSPHIILSTLTLFSLSTFKIFHLVTETRKYRANLVQCHTLSNSFISN